MNEEKAMPPEDRARMLAKLWMDSCAKHFNNPEALRSFARQSGFHESPSYDAVSDIREALQLGMPLGNERFAEVICALLGVRRNSGKRGRIAGEPTLVPDATKEQRTLGF